jgi:uncharacterized protein (UPF0332 family)
MGGLLAKSDENIQVAKKCLGIKAYNAGISRAYYAAFQRVEYVLKSSSVFDYENFLETNKINREHIPHGKMQQAMTNYIMASKKKVSLGKIIVYDDLYRKRRLADYSDRMFTEPDLQQSLDEMNTIFDLIA